MQGRHWEQLTLEMAMLAWTSVSDAAVRTKIVEYKHADAILEGCLAWDDAAEDRRPGVLVGHDSGPGD